MIAVAPSLPPLARAQATLLGARSVTVNAGSHVVFVDEAGRLGAAVTGPSPYEVLLASLGACTAMTLRIYAERKQWALGTVHVDLAFVREGEVERIDRTVRVAEALSPAQVERLLEIAQKTPVTRTLLRSLEIPTKLLHGQGG